MDAAAPPPTFVRVGPHLPLRPVLLSVPHAGRDYPDELLANAAVPLDKLESLEDRHVDALVSCAVVEGSPAIVATRPRCWLDLNRDEREVDPATVHPAPPAFRLIQSAKLRGGLGLIPRRVAGIGELWRAPIAATDLEGRVVSHHRPYHAAIADELARMRSRFGTAVLIDCHSMPPVAGDGHAPAPQIVIGDRYGRSASTRFVERLVALAQAAGHPVARNAPYAGGYTLDRHGRPERGIHAVQVEFDRTLYLGSDRRTLAPAAAMLRLLIARMATAMADEAGADRPAIAAE